MGALVESDGVNFAVFSENATQIYVCLFDDSGVETRIALPEFDGGIWHGHIAGIGAGQLYGLRADGPYRPDDGHRFNVHKLLLDPYARQITGHPEYDDAIYGYDRGAEARDLSFDTRDSVNFMPRCVVTDYAPEAAVHPDTPDDETVIYEAHVSGLTQRLPGVEGAGTFAGVASDPVLAHLKRLGVTAIEMLPVQAFLNDRFLVDKGLVNYWGYQTVGFFAPDHRYLGPDGIAGFRAMVDRFHEAGIEVILDVVYNHSGEGDELGPTLSFRGLDNASYYRLHDDQRYYINDTGTGNTLNVDRPMVLRMVMDSLRYWVEVMGVDGFRFDLAAVLGRTAEGFDQGAGFFDAIRQDPALATTKLIAEPWDIGPGGYQLGAFPPPFQEWNDKFRDGVRRFWRGDVGLAPDLAARLTGSAGEFDHSGRMASASVNFLTAHDGFTLEDLVCYSRRHNEANGENGRDGHSENLSDNFGVEGFSDDPEVLAARGRRKRAMLATMFLAQGTPMLLAGDEFGNSQSGNNNAYNQDNETAWVDWPGADGELTDFVAGLIAFRAAHPILRQKLFLHSRERAVDGLEDLFWWREDGAAMEASDWHDPARKIVAVEKRMAAGTPAYAAMEAAIFMVFNAGGATEVAMPDAPDGQRWCQKVDTSNLDHVAFPVLDDRLEIAEQSVAAFVLIADET
ncbi:MAG: glycogen debranching protein GlgX [Boseongicola sp.]|nr:MAG: glycogen debranching protein GlgX [Boseongicola sp.]